jgi:phosphatidylinositol 4-kinase
MIKLSNLIKKTHLVCPELLNCQVQYVNTFPAAVFQEFWEEKVSRIRGSSPYGEKQSWGLLSAIVKTGADLRQEQFATQLVRQVQKIWDQEGLPIWIC